MNKSIFHLLSQLHVTTLKCMVTTKMFLGVTAVMNPQPHLAAFQHDCDCRDDDDDDDDAENAFTTHSVIENVFCCA